MSLAKRVCMVPKFTLATASLLQAQKSVELGNITNHELACQQNFISCASPALELHDSSCVCMRVGYMQASLLISSCWYLLAGNYSQIQHFYWTTLHLTHTVWLMRYACTFAGSLCQLSTASTTVNSTDPNCKHLDLPCSMNPYTCAEG